MRFKQHRLENVHLHTTSEQRSEVVRFWLDEKALSNTAEAERRAHELVFLIRRNDVCGTLVGVSSAGLMRARNGRRYWTYRMYLRKQDRIPYLSLAVTDATCAHLKERASREGDADGMLIVTENPKLMRRGARTLFQRRGCRHVGRTPRGLDLWLMDFTPPPTAP